MGPTFPARPLKAYRETEEGGGGGGEGEEEVGVGAEEEGEEPLLPPPAFFSSSPSSLSQTKTWYPLAARILPRSLALAAGSTDAEANAPCFLAPRAWT